MIIMKKQWMQKMVTVGVLSGVLALMGGCAGSKTGTEESGLGDTARLSEEPSGEKKTNKVNFLTEVKPLLENYCLRCHNTGLLLGDLNLETRELAFASGQGGPFIVPKKPQSSRFYQVLKLEQGNKKAMPPEKHRMSKEERELIYRWIQQGADWPKDSRGTLRPVVDRPAVAMLGDAGLAH